jgi:hypothetical protein
VQPNARGDGLQTERGRGLGDGESIERHELHQRPVLIRKAAEGLVDVAHLSLGVQSLLHPRQGIGIDQRSSRDAPDGALLALPPAVLVGNHIACDAVQPGDRPSAPGAIPLGGADRR